MKFNDHIEIIKTEEWGTVLKCCDLDSADKLEDFLTEDCFVLFQMKLEENLTSFFFGQAGSVESVVKLCERFIAKLKND